MSWLPEIIAIDGIGTGESGARHRLGVAGEKDCLLVYPSNDGHPLRNPTLIRALSELSLGG